MFPRPARLAGNGPRPILFCLPLPTGWAALGTDFEPGARSEHSEPGQDLRAASRCRHRRQRHADQRRLHGAAKPGRLRLSGRGLSGQSEARGGARDPGLQGHSEPAARRRPGRDLHAGRQRADAGASVRRGGHARHRDHLGRFPRDRRGRPEAGRTRPRRSSASSTACGFSGPNCLGIIVPGDQPQRQFRRRHARQGTHRLHLPVRRACAPRCSIGPWTKASASRTSFPWATCST